MSDEKFVYVTYIASTPEKVWKALLEGELTRQYWGGHENVSSLKSFLETGRPLDVRA
jgi:uncharacterized protein YndB with AHSA1/START domain